jgi:hypothetical protein
MRGKCFATWKIDKLNMTCNTKQYKNDKKETETNENE